MKLVSRWAGGTSLLLSFVFVAFAQGPPKPVLFLEFGRVPCEQQLAQLDGFIQEISNNPDSTAFVAITPQKGKESVFTQGSVKLTLSRFQLANLDDRLRIIVGPESDAFRAQLWLSPAGAELPQFEGVEWLERFRDRSKPFVFGYEDENEICSTFVPRKYAELILDNPGSIAHIVVRRGDKNAMPASAFGRQWVETLTKQFNIPRKRIKVFYATGDQGVTYGEFWFVPKRK